VRCRQDQHLEQQQRLQQGSDCGICQTTAAAGAAAEQPADLHWGSHKKRATRTAAGTSHATGKRSRLGSSEAAQPSTEASVLGLEGAGAATAAVPSRFTVRSLAAGVAAVFSRRGRS
jgi:hypothetical protein